MKDRHDGRNPTDYGPELSRRARGFAAWAVFQALGRKGIEEMVDRHCRCARRLADRLVGIPGIRVLNDVVLNQVAIAFGGNEPFEECDKKTASVIRKIREENRNFVLGASWKGQAILRISVISRFTDVEDIEALAEGIIRAWNAVQAEG